MIPPSLLRTLFSVFLRSGIRKQRVSDYWKTDYISPTQMKETVKLLDYGTDPFSRDARGFKTQEDISAGLIPNFTNSLRQTRTHNDADQLLTAGAGQYSYDPNGCLTNSDGAIYSYDFDNRLTSVNGTEYIYDASGARVGRVTSPGVTNYFVIDYRAPLKMPLAETDAEGHITRYYVWGTHGLLCHLDMNPTNGAVVATRYYHADEQGSTLALTDESGAVTDQFAYSPYGQALGRTGTNNTPYQWLGGYGVYYDSSTDLHLTLHRAYSANMRRFISADPLGIDGGVNLYAYGNLNPLAFVDPQGLWGENIHFGSDDFGGTLQWAQDANFTENQSLIIARANNAVDKGSTAPWPVIGDQSRHFDTNPQGITGTATDTRMVHAQQYLTTAIQYQNRANDLRENAWFFPQTRAGFAENKALKALGTGLHSLQDIDAHADQFVNRNFGVYHHLGAGMEADATGPVGSPNQRLLNTQSASMGYLNSFRNSTGQGGPLK